MPCRAEPHRPRCAAPGTARSQPAESSAWTPGMGAADPFLTPGPTSHPCIKLAWKSRTRSQPAGPTAKDGARGGELPAGAFGWPRAPLGAFPLVPAPGEDGRRFGLSEESGKHLPRCFSLGFLPPPKPRREPGSAATSSPPHPGSHLGLGTSGGPSVSRESQGDPAPSRGGCPHSPGSPRPTPRRDSLAAGRGLRFT